MAMAIMGGLLVATVLTLLSAAGVVRRVVRVRRDEPIPAASPQAGLRPGAAPG